MPVLFNDIMDEYSILDRAAYYEDVDVSEMEAHLKTLQGDVRDKVINIGKIIGNLRADAEAMREAEKHMADRRRTIEGKVERLKEYLMAEMKAADVQKVDCPEFSVKLRLCPSKVLILDEKIIPMDYIRVLQPEIDKKKILEDWKLGVRPDGVDVTQDYTISIK